MEKIFDRPACLPESGNLFCPGCGHSIAHNLIGAAIDKYDLAKNTIYISSVGCAGAGGNINLNSLFAAHGRAPACATAIKRCNPDTFVYTYQGDGDLASIGMAETMHAANRGENITIIFANNCNFGMTGGQMAPTTMLGQASSTSQAGRDESQHGYPFKMAEMIAQLEAPKYVARFSLHDVPNILKSEEGIEKAFEMQMNKQGYSFVELLTMCPTNWKLSPVEANWFVKDVILKTYPVGVLKG